MANTVSATLKLFDSFSGTLDKINGSMTKASSKMTEFRDSVSKPIGGGGGMFKSMLGAQLVGNVVSSGMSMAQNAIGGLMGDLDESSKAWQTFNGNMEQLQMPTKDIAAAKADMQDFATKTIYSASDMASTYSQLAAVGIKSTGKLVKGFGGLAAASTDPTQAMKTLSQQATQMAAKPMVQWADFKLMLEQTPAGIAAVAKTMGKSASQLVSDVQGGKIKTEEFFQAIEKTGTNSTFTKMATQFKTVGQAVDGLKENLVNGLQKAYDSASKKGIDFVTKLADGVSKIDFTGIFDKVFSMLESGFNKVSSFAKTFWKDFSATGAVQEVKDAFQAVGWAITALYNAFKSNFSDMAGNSKSFGTIVGDAVKSAAQGIEQLTKFINSMNPDQVKELAKGLIQVATGILGFKAASKIIGEVGTALGGLSKAFDAITKHPILSTIALLAGAFLSAYTTNKKFREEVNQAASAIGKFLSKLDFGKIGTGIGIVAGLALGITGLAKVMGISFGMFKKLKNPLKPLEEATKGGSPLQSIADGFKSLEKAAGIALVVASIALLAKAMEGIANAGANAVPNMATFGVVVAGLAGAFALFGKSLTTNMTGIAVFAASVGGMALAMTPLANASAQAVPNMAAFGLVVGGLAAVFALAGASLQASAVGIAVFAGAVSILALSMTGIANAGTGAVANMATFGLVIGGLAIVFAILGPALTAAIPAMLAFGAAVLMAGAGIGAAAPAIQALLPVITALGSAFSQVVGTIGSAVTQIVNAIGTQLVNVFKQAGDSISQAADAIGTNVGKIANAIGDMASKIGGGIKSVLDGVADVISSIGHAAENAGTGFKSLAQGVKMLSDVGIMRIGAIMGEVATGIGAVTAVSGGMSSAGKGLMAMGMGAAMLLGSAPILSFILPVMAAALGQIAPVAPQAAAGMAQIGSASVVAAAGITVFSSGLTIAVAALTILGSLITVFATGMGMVAPATTAAASSLMLLTAAATATMVALMTITTASMIAGSGLMLLMTTTMSASMGLMAIIPAAMATAAGLMVIAPAAMATAVGLMILAPAGAAASAGLMVIGSGAMVAISALSALDGSVQMGVAALTVLGATSASMSAQMVAAFAALASAVASSMAAAVSSVSSGMAQCVSIVNSQSGALEGAGVNFVQGFINGINSQVGAAAAAAAKMAQAASSAAKSNLDIHSPSRVMRDTVGKYFTLGFAEGITDHTPDAVRASNDMTSATVAGSGADVLGAATGATTTDGGKKSVSISIGAGAFQIALPDGSPQSVQNLVRALEKYFVDLESSSLEYL